MYTVKEINCTNGTLYVAVKVDAAGKTLKLIGHADDPFTARELAEEAEREDDHDDE